MKKQSSKKDLSRPPKVRPKSNSWRSVFFIAKYSFEFKLKVVQEYLDRKGEYSYLAKVHSVKDRRQILDWVNSYREFGEEGLLRKRKNANYSVQFKLDTIELYQTSELSYREIANVLKMNNPSLIANWMRKFRDDGIDGLSKTKGCPSALAEKKEQKKKRPIETTPEEQDRIKELEKQVRSLQIENALAIMEGLEEAIAITADCPYRRTFHSDQRWAYQMKSYRQKLKKQKIFQSMSRKGNCLDNSIMENFFNLLKQEIFHGKPITVLMN